MYDHEVEPHRTRVHEVMDVALNDAEVASQQFGKFVKESKQEGGLLSSLRRVGREKEMGKDMLGNLRATERRMRRMFHVYSQ